MYPNNGSNLAQTVGFEPTCRFTDKLISSQPRYDHFDTTPYLLLSQAYYSNEPEENQGESPGFRGFMQLHSFFSVRHTSCV